MDTKAAETALSIKYHPKPYHHVKLDSKFKKDCQVWLQFLSSTNLAEIVNRPMVDLSEVVMAKDISFTSDASAAEHLGFGCLLQDKWIFAKWEPGYIKLFNPSIEYLELYALCAGLLTWEDHPALNNCRIVVFCDNQAVVHMVNNTTSSCPNCMFLLRILMLNGLRHNRRVFARYISTKDNFLSDALSRQKISLFKKQAPWARRYPDAVHPDLWPASKIWQRI